MERLELNFEKVRIEKRIFYRSKVDSFVVCSRRHLKFRTILTWENYRHEMVKIPQNGGP